MCHCVTALFWVLDGKQKVGRSRTTWRRTAEREKVEAGWGYWDQLRDCARERAGWRDLMRNTARRCEVMWREVG